MAKKDEDDKPKTCLKQGHPIYLWDKANTGPPASWREFHPEQSVPEGAGPKPCLDKLAREQINGADVAVVLAHGDRCREHDECKVALTKYFKMPEVWFTDYARRSNGYFACETQTDDLGNPTGMVYWIMLQVKICKGRDDYQWYKLNTFVCWDRSSGKTAIFIFDPHDDLLKPHNDREKHLPRMILDLLTPKMLLDPFWVLPSILENIVSVQNKSVWGIRDLIRAGEKAREKYDVARRPDGRPKSDFAMLHDIARHAIHGVETLEVSKVTAQSIVDQHMALKEIFDDMPAHHKLAFRAAHHKVHGRIRYFKHLLESLLERSSSNKQRLDNEIQLVFNSVAQYDAGLNLQISQATRADSAAMTTIAFLTLAFFPATFIAAIFSMSFFNQDPDAGWTVAPQIWMYFVIAIPVTALVSGVWWKYQKALTKRARESLHDGTFYEK